jgi:hypothetical protein
MPQLTLQSEQAEVHIRVGSAPSSVPNVFALATRIQKWARRLFPALWEGVAPGPLGRGSGGSIRPRSGLREGGPSGELPGKPPVSCVWKPPGQTQKLEAPPSGPAAMGKNFGRAALSAVSRLRSIVGALRRGPRARRPADLPLAGAEASHRAGSSNQLPAGSEGPSRSAFFLDVAPSDAEKPFASVAKQIRQPARRSANARRPAKRGFPDNGHDYDRCGHGPGRWDSRSGPAGRHSA